MCGKTLIFKISKTKKISLKNSIIILFKTLDIFINENDIDVDNLYLKVEAEGFEPEIIEGLGNNRPRVIAVDVTAERNMESPRVEIENQLKKWGYETYNTHRCLFGLKDE